MVLLPVLLPTMYLHIYALYLFFIIASNISLSGIDELEKRNKERKIKISEKKELHFSPRACTA